MTGERAARLTALGLVWTSGQTGDTGTRICPSVPCASAVSAKWEAQLARLAAYKAARGDCRVPHGWAEDPKLANWVMTQRQRKRKLDRGDSSPEMTAERAARLTALGLEWEAPKEAKWEAQLARLAAYKAARGDCRVPHGWAEDPKLANWVMTQRANLRRGMTAERAARLAALGLVFHPTS
jgi:hypothetical protein